MVFFLGIIFISILTSDFLLQFQLTLVPDFFFFSHLAITFCFVSHSIFWCIYSKDWFSLLSSHFYFGYHSHIYFNYDKSVSFWWSKVKICLYFKTKFHFKLIFMLRNKIQHLDYIPAASRITHASNFIFSQS